MKLQPTYIWTKLSSAEEETQDAYQYYLQREHTVVSNAINATIDDASNYTKERPTAFTWIDGSQIFTQTFTGVLSGTSDNATSHNITGLSVLVQAYGSIQDAVPMAVQALPIPFSDVAGDFVTVIVTPTQYEIVLNNGTYSGYTYFLTLRYTKLKV